MPKTPSANAKSTDKVHILIPAYEPDMTLVKIVKELRTACKYPIIIVNDGSGNKASEVFAACANISNLTVLEHDVNRGKGAALKTGLNHVYTSHPNAAGVVTADADGQHTTEDILKICQKLQTETVKNKPTLWLGMRYQDGSHYIPLRSRIGNTFSSLLFCIATRRWLKDTQTGLRGIPLSMVPALLDVENNGFAFETDMLLIASRKKYSYGKVSIETVYEPGNPSSHFKPIQDTVVILGQFIKFIAVGGISAGLDYAVFALLYWQTGEILLSILLARLVSAIFNFTTSRKFVFKASNPLTSQAVRYTVVCSAVALLSYGLTKALYLAGLSPFIGKILADTIIFILSYIGLRKFVFKTSY